MANPAIVVDFVANTRELSKGFDDASKKTSGFGDKLKGIAKGGALAAGAAGVGGLVATLKIGVDEFAEAQKVGAQTNSVIKSTGKAAGVTSKHVSDLAGSLMEKSGVDDEAIQSGENLLLTFTNIRNEAGKGNDIFDQTTKAALDMSVALGTDMKSASMTMGKALNDPIKGMGKLAKQGVTFTDAQKKQAEAMVKAGDAAGAQKIILAEVNKEFGGSAEAAGKTLPGQLSILKEKFGNLAGDLVAKIIPVIQDVVKWLKDKWPEITKAFEKMWEAVKPILDNLWELLKTVADIIIDHWPQIKPIVDSVVKQIEIAAKIIGTAIKLVTDILKGDWKAAWEDVKKIVGLALDLVKERLTMFVEIFGKVAKALGNAILNGIKDGVGAIGGWIKDRLDGIKDSIVTAAVTVFNAAVRFGKGIFNGVVDGVTGLYTEIRDRISGMVDAVGDFVDRAFSKARQVGSGIFEGIKAGISGVVGAVKGTVQSALNAVIDLVNKFRIPPVKIAGKTVFKGWGGLNIPHVALAAGGIVTSPTFALIGERGPEAVIPLSGAGGAPVEVRVYIGDQELTALVRTVIVDHDTGLARTLLAGAA